MAQSGHAIRNSKVRFRGQSRHRSDMPFCLLIIQSRHFQLRLVGPVFWPRLRLIALNRCVSLSRASIFSSSRVILDLGSSVSGRRLRIEVQSFVRRRSRLSNYHQPLVVVLRRLHTTLFEPIAHFMKRKNRECGHALSLFGGESLIERLPRFGEFPQVG
jgi:hypothetical protein